eukprot:4840240-Pleurochrysis_carterae.AAC.1
MARRGGADTSETPSGGSPSDGVAVPGPKGRSCGRARHELVCVRAAVCACKRGDVRAGARAVVRAGVHA